VGVASGEGKGVLSYLLVVLERLGVAGAVLPTGGRAGGWRRAAAVGLRRPGEEGVGLGRCGGERGS
jgi:hypothetical protein